jgi:hypothetical protein
MYSGEGTEALSTAGAAICRSEVDGAGAGAGACRGSLVQYRLLKATPSTGATCENMPISEGSAEDPLVGPEPDRLTRKNGEEIILLRWQVRPMVLNQSCGLLLPSPANTASGETAVGISLHFELHLQAFTQDDHLHYAEACLVLCI